MRELNKVILFGDTHFDDTFTGTHIDYKASSLRLLEHLTGIVEKEKPDAVIFMGDFIGVHRKNIKSRAYLLEIVKFLQNLNDLTGNNIYSLLGNHDMGGTTITDTALMVELGLLKNPSFLDIPNSSHKSPVRFHFVNYGAEYEPITKIEKGSNVILGHNDFAFNFETLYDKNRGGVVLANHTTWEGVELIISGHIHMPSHQIVSGRIGDSVANLFYVGSPARVSRGEKYQDCWYVVFEVDENKSNYEAKEVGLWPFEEEFEPEIEKTEDEKEKILRVKALRGIIQELNESKLLYGSLLDQIDKVPMVDIKVKKRAKEILQRVQS